MEKGTNSVNKLNMFVQIRVTQKYPDDKHKLLINIIDYRSVQLQVSEIQCGSRGSFEE